MDEDDVEVDTLVFPPDAVISTDDAMQRRDASRTIYLSGDGVPLSLTPEATAAVEASLQRYIAAHPQGEYTPAFGLGFETRLIATLLDEGWVEVRIVSRARVD